MAMDLCAVVLAGGQSRRMGFNKALLTVGRTLLIERVVASVRPLTDTILVSSNDPGPYEFLGLPIIADLFKGQGPLAGLHAAMVRSSQTLYLLLACDMPNLREVSLRRLVLAAEGFDAVIPRTPDGGNHPLCAVYRKTCLPVIESNLQRGANRVTDLFLESSLNVRWVAEVSEWEMVNLNSPDDLISFQKHL